MAVTARYDSDDEGALGRNALCWASPTVPLPSASCSGATQHVPDAFRDQSARETTAVSHQLQADTRAPLFATLDWASIKSSAWPGADATKLPYLELLMRFRHGGLQDAKDGAGRVPRTDN